MLYLQSLCDMHPYLAAAGHNNYTKSLALFIPKMIDLKRTHPDVYEAFANKGLFPVRRTDGVWSGIFTDLFIEQVLMAGLKTSGGLTRGRGFNEVLVYSYFSQDPYVQRSASPSSISPGCPQMNKMAIVTSQQLVFSEICQISKSC